jgi:hypothetical protein
MTYSVFNRDSGNLIDSFRSEERALALIAAMLADPENEPDSIGLVVTDRERTISTLSGYELQEALGVEAAHLTA